MPTRYVCTFIEKTGCVDDFDKGCETKYKLVFAKKTFITAPTLPALIVNLERWCNIKIDDVWYPDDENDRASDGHTRIGFNQLEDGLRTQARKPSKAQLAKWKEGKHTLYLCDYSFIIEKRTTEPVPREEFIATNIKTHE